MDRGGPGGAAQGRAKESGACGRITVRDNHAGGLDRRALAHGNPRPFGLAARKGQEGGKTKIGCSKCVADMTISLTDLYGKRGRSCNAIH